MRGDARRRADPGLPDEPRQHLRQPLAPFRLERLLGAPTQNRRVEVAGGVGGELHRVRWPIQPPSRILSEPPGDSAFTSVSSSVNSIVPL